MRSRKEGWKTVAGARCEVAGARCELLSSIGKIKCGQLKLRQMDTSRFPSKKILKHHDQYENMNMVDELRVEIGGAADCSGKNFTVIKPESIVAIQCALATHHILLKNVWYNRMILPYSVKMIF